MTITFSATSPKMAPSSTSDSGETYVISGLTAPRILIILRHTLLVALLIGELEVATPTAEAFESMPIRERFIASCKQ
jgi:hypothetical protein